MEPVETETVAGVGCEEDGVHANQADMERDTDLKATELELQPA